MSLQQNHFSLDNTSFIFLKLCEKSIQGGFPAIYPISHILPDEIYRYLINVTKTCFIRKKIQIFLSPFFPLLFQPRAIVPSQITWIDGAGAVLTAGVEYTKESSPDPRLFTAKSILKLNAYKDLHNRSIHCQAQNSADKTYLSASIRLEVSFNENSLMAFAIYSNHI